MSRPSLLVAALSLNATVALAQSAFDRTKAPVLGKPANLVVPSVNATTLPNGVSLRTVAQRELPLVHIIAVIDGGARLDGRTAGLASFVAGMLDEGAGSRDAASLQAEVAFLGASLTANAGWDASQVSLKVPLRSLEPALDLMADVMLRPHFRAAEVRKQRDLRLANLLQGRDQPNTLANLAFNQIVFPAGHPYHRALGGDSASTMQLDSASVRAFYEGSMRPERTTFFVVGDISLSDAREQIAKRFGAWAARGTALAVPLLTTEPVRQSATRVYLVDKPQAAQSVISIGWPGVERGSPDYTALMVMNTILGGSFTSRLNMNLRETHGYSYGAGSGFTFRRAPGAFSASAAVRTNVTDSSLVEFFKELRGLRDRPVPRDEVERAKAYLELGLPSSLESTSQVAAQLAELATYGLTLSELSRFAREIRAVTAADIQRVAKKYLTPDQATVVVVGDLSVVRTGIEALRLGAVQVLSTNELAK